MRAAMREGFQEGRHASMLRDDGRAGIDEPAGVGDSQRVPTGGAVLDVPRTELAALVRWRRVVARRVSGEDVERDSVHDLMLPQKVI
jgi:hypothetical protein